MLPFEGGSRLERYRERVKGCDRTLSARLFHDRANSMFADGWEFMTGPDGLNLKDIINPESHSDSKLALEAAKMALYTADIDPQRIGAVIHATATPDALGAYSTAARIAKTLGLRKNVRVLGAGIPEVSSLDVAAYDLITGCSGTFDAIFQARSLLMDPTSRIEAILVTASNFTSGNVREFYASKPEGWKAPPGFPGYTSVVLFGDGAGAYVLERAKDDDGRGILHMKKICDSKRNPALALVGGSALPMTESALRHGLEQYYVHHGIVKERAAGLMREAVLLNVAGAIEKGLVPNDYDISRAELVIMHQASKGTLHAAQEIFGLDPKRLVNEVEKRGNIVAASIPVAHEIALKEIAELVDEKGVIMVHLTTIGGGWHAGDAIMRVGPEAREVFERREEYRIRDKGSTGI